jgi:hypothetical protein
MKEMIERAETIFSELGYDVYEKEEIFAGARLFVVPLADGGEAVVAVYSDPAVGGTGVTVHRAPLGEP